MPNVALPRGLLSFLLSGVTPSTGDVRNNSLKDFLGARAWSPIHFQTYIFFTNSESSQNKRNSIAKGKEQKKKESVYNGYMK